MSEEVLVFSHSITPRLQYLIQFLSQYYKLEFRLTSDEGKYASWEHPCKINYSYHPLQKEEIYIHSHALLFESSIRQVKTDCVKMERYIAFFCTEGVLGFDLFAAIFYLLTRYEEYLPHKRDQYGRYAHRNSLASRENFLHLPLINIWLEDFRRLLIEKNEAFRSKQNRPAFSFLPTYDIDMAWSFLHKGSMRNLGGVLSMLAKGRLRSVAYRLKVLKQKLSDPYDAYQWLDEMHSRFGLQPVYFFLLAKDRNKFDKNIHPAQPALQQLVQNTARRYTTGLHPSWASNKLPSLLTEEKHTLEKLTSQPVLHSRHHYIKIDLPKTYQRLLALGIMNDYSMGYGSINGFRASVATSYFWYDLKNEQTTRLLVHPFCFMDANSFYEQKQTPAESLAELFQYAEEVKKVGGQLITIWHNSFLGSSPDFAGWKEIYLEFIGSFSDRLTR